MMKNLVIYFYILHKHFGGVLLSVGDKCDMITLCIPTQHVPLGGANEAYTKRFVFHHYGTYYQYGSYLFSTSTCETIL